MPIRDACPDDLDAICALIRELADYEGLSSEVGLDRGELGHHLFGSEPAASVAIAVTEDAATEPAGFALWYPTFSTFLGRPGIWLEDLFVRPDARGRGLGRELLAHLRNLTDGRVEWAVLDWNEPAISFYRRLGAEPVTGWTRYRWLDPAVDVTPHR
jgi:GNAT superfamily N-acetyltransferase